MLRGWAAPSDWGPSEIQSVLGEFDNALLNLKGLLLDRIGSLGKHVWMPGTGAGRRRRRALACESAAGVHPPPMAATAANDHPQPLTHPISMCCSALEHFHHDQPKDMFGKDGIDLSYRQL